MQPMIHMAGGFEDIIPVLVIFGVLISKIVGASRKAKRGDVEPEPESRPQRKAGADELRKFLETLTGTSLEPEAPAARPKPRKVPVAGVAPVPPPPPVVAPTVAPVVVPAPKHKRRSSKTHEHGAPVLKKYNWNDRPMLKTSILVDPVAIGQDLIDRRSLAKAVVLREILGPPLGLRE